MTLCFHCGEACSNSEHHSELDGERQSFCCIGCRAVAELIFSQSLQSYYRHRTVNAHRVSELPLSPKGEITDFTLVDDDNNLAVDIFVEDLSCPACIWLVERQIRTLPGIISVNSDLSSRRTCVKWQKNSSSVNDVIACIQAIGFRALPYRTDAVEQALASENNKIFRRFVVASFAMMQGMMYSFGIYFGVLSDLTANEANWLRWASLFCTLPVVLYSATPFYRNAWRALKMRSANMDTPVSLGIFTAFLVSAVNTLQGAGTVYFDSVAMFAFLLLGARLLEAQLRHKAGKQAALQHRQMPATVTVLRHNLWQSVALSNVKIGERLRLCAGDAVSIDGLIREGRCTIDEHLLTGESLPVSRQLGEKVLAGSTIISGSIDVDVTACGETTYLSQLGKLQHQALLDRPAWQTLADKIANYFVLFVLLVSVFSYLYWRAHDASKALDVLLAVLVVTCPCALSLALPTAWAASTRALLNKHFLIRRANTLSSLAHVKTIVLDKTGTLTTTSFTLTGCKLFSESCREKCLQIAAALESHSRHPIASAFKFISSHGTIAYDVQEVAGLGLIGFIAEHRYYLGNSSLLPSHLRPLLVEHEDVSIWLADDQKVLAGIVLQDELRTDAYQFVQQAKSAGYTLIIASGDHTTKVQACAEQLSIEKYYAGLLPEQKLALVRERQQYGECVLMIGDGINDTPVLAGADCSVAISAGTDFARRAADAVLSCDRLMVILEALRQSKQTRRIVKQNLYWAVVYNLLALPSAVCGWLTPWEAALGMSVSSLLVTLNSLRLQHDFLSLSLDLFFRKSDSINK